MEPPTITVRPLATDAERRRYFALADEAFDPEPSIEGSEQWMQFVLGLTEYRDDMVRGAFRGDTLLGGYICYPRHMRVGAALVPTGCIGAVVTDPAQRQQRVAETFLRDADDYARQRGDGLLLLDGIPHFYHRFGYVKVADTSEAVIAAAALTALPASARTVRRATLADSEALLALYLQAYGTTSGSFARNAHQQLEKLTNRVENLPYVVEGPDENLSGYLSLPKAAPHTRAFEVIATDEAAIVALLHFHRGLAPEGDLIWTLPAHHPTLYWLQDHLIIPGYDTHDDPRQISAITHRTLHQNDTGWMAKIGDLAALGRALLPTWQQRWQAGWPGSLSLTVGALGTITLTNENGAVTVAAASPAADLALHLTEAHLTQLVFGYRPVDWVARQPGAEGELAAWQMLATLFPHQPAWIPTSDGF
jgi:predicted N-acetyltransferase YhbS